MVQRLKIELIKLKNIRFNLAHFAFFQSGPAPLCFKVCRGTGGFPVRFKSVPGDSRYDSKSVPWVSCFKKQMRGSPVFGKSNATCVNFWHTSQICAASISMSRVPGISGTLLTHSLLVQSGNPTPLGNSHRSPRAGVQVGTGGTHPINY